MYINIYEIISTQLLIVRNNIYRSLTLSQFYVCQLTFFHLTRQICDLPIMRNNQSIYLTVSGLIQVLLVCLLLAQIALISNCCPKVREDSKLNFEGLTPDSYFPNIQGTTVFRKCLKMLAGQEVSNVEWRRTVHTLHEKISVMHSKNLKMWNKKLFTEYC